MNNNKKETIQEEIKNRLEQNRVCIKQMNEIWDKQITKRIKIRICNSVVYIKLISNDEIMHLIEVEDAH